MFIHQLCYFQTEGIRCCGNLVHASPDLICGTGLPGVSQGFGSGANTLQDERARADDILFKWPMLLPFNTQYDTCVRDVSAHENAVSAAGHRTCAEHSDRSCWAPATPIAFPSS